MCPICNLYTRACVRQVQNEQFCFTTVQIVTIVLFIQALMYRNVGQKVEILSKPQLSNKSTALYNS